MLRRAMLTISHARAHANTQPHAATLTCSFDATSHIFVINTLK
jgi:hypothetical protein